MKMNVNVGITEFEKVIQEADKIGKWEAWYKYYYKKYQDVFDAQLHYLYMLRLEDLKNIVESVDFDQMYQNAVKNYKEDIHNRLLHITEQVIEEMSFNKQFSLYILIGLGHIDGTALPSTSPILYFGIERLKGADDLNILIPHEINHLVRLVSLPDEFNNKSTWTVKQLTIAEGLATLYPLLFNNIKITDESIKKALMVDEKDFIHLRDNTDHLYHDIVNIWDMTLDQNIMKKYFMANSGSELNKSGYYIGSIIIQKLISKGYSIKELTKMQTNKIVELYKGGNDVLIEHR
jgi:hypothetical protein